METKPPTTAPEAKLKYSATPPALKLLRVKLRLQGLVSPNWAFQTAWQLFLRLADYQPKPGKQRLWPTPPSSVVERIDCTFKQKYGRRFESFNILETGPHLPVQNAMLLHDRQDPSEPFRDAEETAAHWPGLDFRPTTGLGHVRIMRDPAVLRQVVEFLA